MSFIADRPLVLYIKLEYNLLDFFFLEDFFKKNNIKPYFTTYRDTLSNFKSPAYNIVGVLETNGFGDLAHKYALEAVRFNPDSYESWRNLNQISKSTEAERAQALQNMTRLDPLNPNITVPKK